MALGPFAKKKKKPHHTARCRVTNGIARSACNSFQTFPHAWPTSTSQRFLSKHQKEKSLLRSLQHTSKTLEGRSATFMVQFFFPKLLPQLLGERGTPWRPFFFDFLLNFPFFDFPFFGRGFFFQFFIFSCFSFVSFHFLCSCFFVLAFLFFVMYTRAGQT